MSFFNKIGEKITQTSQSAAHKTKIAAETLKLKSMISEEEKNINNIYQQIGKMYYETFGDNTEQPFVGQLITKIKDSEEKISTYEDQVKKLKGITNCENCGGDVQEEAPYCGSCGSAMNNAPIATTPTVNDVVCDQCDFTVPSDTQFCPNCGNMVKPLAEAIADELVTIDELIADSPILAAEPKTIQCPACEAKLEADNAFCLNCGQKIDG